MPKSVRGLFLGSKTSNAPQDPIAEIIHRIRRLMQAAELYSKKLDKNYGLTSAQLHTILALYENGPQPPSQLAKRVMVKSSTITGIVDRLERKGLVTRVRSLRDRRVTNIELTTEGKRLSKKAPSPINQTLVDGLKKLSNSEVQQIVLSLSKLTEMLDVEDIPVE